jgi:ribose transport system ATP-binding protein
MSARVPVVAAHGLVQRFPGVVALDGADLELFEGEVLGLVGKNGAGKSSLIKVLAGVEKPDEGELRIDGEPVGSGFAPHVAHRHGLAFVHQELGNFPGLTVAENVGLGTRYPRRAGILVSHHRLRQKVAGVLAELEADIDPDAPAESLTSVQQRVVMIARALYHEARVLVLDEPSVSLAAEEIAHLHAIVRGLRERGRSVVYVSHRLNEIVALTDRVVVLQDGRVSLERATRDLDEAALVEAIAGPAAHSDEPPPPRPPRDETPLLRVRGLARPPRVFDVSFDVHAGEILGIAGLVGSGRTEVARMVFGADRPAAGAVEIDGRPLKARTPADAIRAGIALLPEDRRHEGLVLDFSVRENVTLASLGKHRTGPLPLPSRGSERQATAEMIGRLGITTPAKGRPGEVAAAGGTRAHLRRAHAGRGRRCQGGDLRAHSRDRRVRPCGDRHLIGLRGARRPLHSGRGAARGPRVGDGRGRRDHRRGAGSSGVRRGRVNPTLRREACTGTGRTRGRRGACR